MRLSLVLIVPFVAGLAASQSTSAPVVDLGYARYRGVVNPDTRNTEFLGVRYAAPPTGPLRWRAAQPPQPTSGIQLANRHPNICYQAPLGINLENPLREGAVTQPVDIDAENWQPIASPLGLVQSEDCLFLNVYAPGTTIPHKLLPVVVWIHGGGYFLGSASEPNFAPFDGIYDGNDLIKQAGGKVVVVSIQYRLGILGLLAGKEVKKNGALNLALLDQQFALQWVQKHIAKFGGDPRKVTIWGESAGGGSVLQHLVANGGKTQPRLFRGGMLSSPSLTPQYPFDHRINEYQFARVVSLAGCSSSVNKLDCLRTVNSTKIQAANVQLFAEALYGTAALAPVVDGSFIRESPSRSVQKGKVNTDNILVVRNTNEAFFFTNPNLTDATRYIHDYFPTFTAAQSAQVAQLYERDFSTVAEQAAFIHGEVQFLCPSYLLSKSLSGHVYQGHFAIPPAYHTDDVPYYFPSVGAPAIPPFNNTQFTNTFAQSFMDFVLEQDPNKKHDPASILPRWPKWSRSSPIEVVFNKTGSAPDIARAVSDAKLRERCQVWEGLIPSTFL